MNIENRAASHWLGNNWQLASCVILAGLLMGSLMSEPAWGKWPPLRLLPARREGEAPPQRPCPDCQQSLAGRLHDAGHPENIAWWAKPSETPAYGGYYVGGGAPFPARGKSRPRSPYEGTFGWDYFGEHFHRRVDLGWLPWNRQHRAGIEGYETDGPHFLEQLKPE